MSGPSTAASAKPGNLKCRQCGAMVTVVSVSCLTCGCRPPLACAACGKAIGGHHLSTSANEPYPYGSFNAQGDPLCQDHRLTRCFKCKSLVSRIDTEQRVIEWSNSNKPITARLCPECGEGHADPSQHPEWHFRIHAAGLWIALLILLIVVGVVVTMGR